MKPLHRQFILRVQQTVKEANAKYIHPVSDPKYFCYVHKKPGLPKKAHTMKQINDESESPFPRSLAKKAKPEAESDSNSVQDLLSMGKNLSPAKDSLAELSTT